MKTVTITVEEKGVKTTLPIVTSDTKGTHKFAVGDNSLQAVGAIYLPKANGKSANGKSTKSSK